MIYTKEIISKHTAFSTKCLALSVENKKNYIHKIYDVKKYPETLFHRNTISNTILIFYVYANSEFEEHIFYKSHNEADLLIELVKQGIHYRDALEIVLL